VQGIFYLAVAYVSVNTSEVIVLGHRCLLCVHHMEYITLTCDREVVSVRPHVSSPKLLTAFPLMLVLQKDCMRIGVEIT
jgi:hypothetical protein